MTSGLTDTDVESLMFQVGLFRLATPARELELAFGLSADVMALSVEGLRRRHPGLSPRDVRLRFVEIHYGVELAEAVRARMERGGSA